MFGSPVAQSHCFDDGRCITGSYLFAQYEAGGKYTWDYNAQRDAEDRWAIERFNQQLNAIAATLGISRDRLLAMQNLGQGQASRADLLHPYLQGGNWNFLLTGLSLPSDCGGGARCGEYPSLHFHFDDMGQPQYVHMDTANPFRDFPAGLIVHGVVDVLLGNTIFGYGIPR